MISIVIRNRNEAAGLRFLLHTLTTRYAGNFKEIILVDNDSTDNSVQVGKEYNCIITSIKNFGYGRALNLGVSHASQEIIVSFSAHCYPVNTDFFTSILQTIQPSKVAGIRPLVFDKDYRNYFQGRSAKSNYADCGLVNSCSAFKKSLWELHPFEETMFGEDKEWTRHFLQLGYDVVFSESFASYKIQRSAKALFNRYTQEISGWHKLEGRQTTLSKSLRLFAAELFASLRIFLTTVWYAMKKLTFNMGYLLKR